MSKIKAFWEEWWWILVPIISMFFMIGAILLDVYVDSIRKDQVTQFLVEAEGWSQGKAEVWIYKNCKRAPKCLREDYLERYATWCGEKGLEWK